jgi:DNA uptake protein ComE-like DNA-binding protein
MKSLLALMLVAGACWCSHAPANELGILVPVVVNGQALQKADPRGRTVPVVTQLRSGALYDQLRKEAGRGATALVLVLDDLAQRKAGATDTSPTWLLLSDRDGGFARKGFWLRDTPDDRERPSDRDRRARDEPASPSAERFVADPFVDLLVDANFVANGGFEEIFAHEMGHVFLRRLLPRLPYGYSRTPHMSLSITDNPTAFDEGFATHMQGLARRLTENESLRNQDLGLESRPFLSYWLSNLDRANRIDGVRRNWFVQAQVTAPGSGDAMMRRDHSTLFDTTRLKNGNQMMASEGVIATLFYRWLVPGSVERAAILQRYSMLFDALVALNHRPPANQKLDADAPLFLDMIEAYRATNPKESARLLALTIETTYGATADGALTVQFESLAADGRAGDIEKFSSGLKSARAALEHLQQTVAQSPSAARSALGPDIWLFRERPSAIAINLNTAERESLLVLPGVDAAAADRALESRRSKGPFKDVTDFAKRSALGPAAVAQLPTMLEAMTKAGTFPRE